MSQWMLLSDKPDIERTKKERLSGRKVTDIWE